MSELQIPALYFYDLSVDFEDFEKPGIDIIMKQKAKLWH
jgi:methyl coenzyme M reductase subunit C